MASKQIRPIRVEGNIAYVTLTKGYVAMIDADDVPLVEGVNWYAKVTPHTVYAKRSAWVDGRNRCEGLHQRILKVPPDMQVDHIDNNGLNNRRSNLRPATPGQNQHNQRARIDNRSGFKGVTWDSRSRVWEVRCRVNGKRLYLGQFFTLQAAVECAKKHRRALHGEFAKEA